MKDYTLKGRNNNENPSLPPQWNNCRDKCCGGIVKKTEKTQLCRRCREAHIVREVRDGIEARESDWSYHNINVSGKSHSSYTEGMLDEVIRRRGS